MKRKAHGKSHYKKTAAMILLSLLLIVQAVPLTVKAEGSRDLVGNSGTRPYLEYFDDTSSKTANMSRRTIINTYAKGGETIYFASSAVGQCISMTLPNGVVKDYTTVYDENDSSTLKDSTVVYNSATNSVGNNENSKSIGFIANPAQEGQGPYIPDIKENGGYVPLSFKAEEEGIYSFTFLDRGANSGSANPSPINTNESFYGKCSKPACGTVAAWDITVVDRFNNICCGRCFSETLFLNMGANDKSLNSYVYVVTDDGFIYRINFNGMDPYGFVLFANNRGVLYKHVVGDEAIVQSAYHSFYARDNNLSDINTTASIQGNYVNGSIANAECYDEDMDATYRIFYNEPDEDVLDYLRITPVHELGAIREGSLHFSGFENNKAFVAEGGIFSFDIPTSCGATSYEIRLNIKNAQGKDTSATIANAIDKTKEHQKAYWDGTDSKGDVVPAGNYSTGEFSLVLKAGEVHFPMLDVENNPKGIIIERKGIDGSYGPTTVFYNNKLSSDTLPVYAPSLKSVVTIGDGLDKSIDGVESGAVMKFSGGEGNQALLDIWTHAEQKVLVQAQDAFEIVSSVAVGKYDAADNGEFTDRDLLGGAQFQVYNSSNQPIMFTSGQYNSSAVYTYEGAGDGKATTMTTVAANKLHMIGLPSGEYTLKEVKAPEGYINSEQIIDFTVEEGSSKTQEIDVHNDFISEGSRITLEKYSSIDKTKLLAGASFCLSVCSFNGGVYDEKNAVADTGHILCFRVSTDNVYHNVYVFDGVTKSIGEADPMGYTSSITTNNEKPVYIVGLETGGIYNSIASGIYAGDSGRAFLYFEETDAPAGFGITYSGQCISYFPGGSTQDYAKHTIKVMDDPETELYIEKYAEGSVHNEAYILGGAVFNISDANGQKIYFTKDDNGFYHYTDSYTKGADASIATSKGQALRVYGLPAGSYTVEEKTPPLGYLLSQSIQEAVITVGKRLTLAFDNPVDISAQTVDVYGRTLWNGGAIPDNTEVRLYADGVLTDAVMLWDKTGNLWTYEFDGVPKYSSGTTEVNYTIKEGLLKNGTFIPAEESIRIGNDVYSVKYEGNDIINTYVKTIKQYTITISYYDMNGSSIIGDYSIVLDENESYNVIDKKKDSIGEFIYNSTTGDELWGILDGNKHIALYYERTSSGEENPPEPTKPDAPEHEDIKDSDKPPKPDIEEKPSYDDNEIISGNTDKPSVPEKVVVESPDTGDYCHIERYFIEMMVSLMIFIALVYKSYFYKKPMH